ncbi:MAG: hypothetical protein II215_04890, partial [Paludibacteraceae bacterium]|nr:hypothetical protein [Paludibacteraceae bacterium]
MKQKKITTGSNIRTWFARFLMLTCFLVSFTAAAVADSGFWSSGAANVKISGVWQSELNSGNVNDIDLGSVSTAPIIEQAWAKVWGDGAIDKVYFCYRIDDGTITEVISDDQNLGSGDKAYNWNSLNITLPNTIDSHVVEFWFKTNNDKYLSNNSQNYKIVYEIEGPTMQCDPQNTKVIFRENFDFPALTSETSRCEYRRTLAQDGYEAWVPAKKSAGAQGYTYMEACKAMKDNGYYAVVVDPQWGGCGDQSNGDDNACKCEGSKWFRHEESTSGSGGMLMFNANNGEDSTPDILYACKVDVCKNTYINFSAFIAPANAHRPGTGCDGNYNPASV